MDLRDIIEFFKDTFKYIIVVVVIIVFLVYVCGLEQVIGPSMNPTMKQNDIVLVNKLITNVKDIQRNDVLIINQDEKHMIKRVVGLPGEYIEYKDNYLYVNNIKYKEAFIEGINTKDFKLEDLIGNYKKIPKDMYLVLGDNRENSLDSRDYGLIKKENIIGKAWIRIWPLNKIKLVK